MAPPTLCSLPLESLLRVCELLSEWHEGQQSTPRRDLTSLALTCRFLSEPAFNTLWHNLRDIAPLLCTLPWDLCTTAPFIYQRTKESDPKTGSQLASFFADA